MAALTSTGVTVSDTWKSGGTSSRKFLCKDVTLVLASQGGLTNNIPASLFGMTRIITAQCFRDTTSSEIFYASPSATGAYLVFADSETAGTPADQTATVRGVVCGYDS